MDVVQRVEWDDVDSIVDMIVNEDLCFDLRFGTVRGVLGVARRWLGKFCHGDFVQYPQINFESARFFNLIVHISIAPFEIDVNVLVKGNI